MLTLVTSNPSKLADYRAMGLDMGFERGADLPEADADELTVVLHKARMAGEGRVVEDTSLEVEGAAVGANVRWLEASLPEYVGRRARWRVMLGVHRDGAVEVYEGVTDGEIVPPEGTLDPWFAFATLFRPDGTPETLAALMARGEHRAFSARARAAAALAEGRPIAVRTVAEVGEWTGPWQGEGG